MNIFKEIITNINYERTSMIKVRNLVFDYMTKRALHSVSFEIEKGSIVALIGPNGAGKTTLMRCLAGLVKPFSGEIYLDDINVPEDSRNAHRYISYLSDVFGLYDDLTARQCLKYAALAYDIKEKDIDAAIEKTAKKLKLTEHLDTFAGNLSRGLRQKLAIAQVIIHSPKFIILDEPASGLDPEARLELSELFVQLRNEGHTLLISSHILAELEDYATDVIVLDNGHLVKKEKIAANNKTSTDETIPVVINVASKHKKLEDLLKKETNVKDVSNSENGVKFRYKGKDKDLAKLLKKVIDADFDVIEFMKEKSLLKNAYFETVKKGK